MSKLDKAIKEGKGIEVWVSHPDLVDYEIIINSKRNVEAKKEYYDKAYTDAMELENYKLITIVNVRLIN